MTDLEKLRDRADKQASWLAVNAPHVTAEQKHLDEGSTERAYWHYGYMVALRDMLKLLETETLRERRIMASKRLTKAEADALVTAAEFLLAGEWDETLSQKEADALRRAADKLKQRNADSGAE